MKFLTCAVRVLIGQDDGLRQLCGLFLRSRQTMAELPVTAKDLVTLVQ